ncbi:translation initiation factor IF-2-like isoform X5 [Prionailurus viverrinus]|uniref:translation initiation factor IF-2-like isoform X5 n=1 Tax=Prionailurus viverrinus TaxID=61388 RepID=UPI001FF33B9A|nr:translation initiation factor IF-2-like isoform X5 [Prionailurus viverrinus]
MDSKPPGSDPREVLGQCRPSPGPLAGRGGGGGGRDTAGRPLLLKSWMQPRWEAEVPRGALAIRPDPPWGALGPARGPAALPLRRACSMSPTRRAWFPRRRRRRRRPGPARSPPAPRPLPARLPALLLALDRGGRTASQNAPPESGAQGPGPGPWGRPPQRAASAEVPREGCRSQEEAAGVWKCQASEEVRQEGRSLTARGLAPLLLTDEEAPVPDPSSCVGSPPAFPGVEWYVCVGSFSVRTLT